MFKVICTANRSLFNKPCEGHWAIKCGEPYTVIERIETRWGVYYRLAEDPEYAYAEEHFSRIDGPDELAIAAEREKTETVPA